MAGPVLATAGDIITDLAELPGEALVTQAYIAHVLGVTARTVRNMVVRNELPGPIQMGRRVYWVAGVLRTYMREAAEREAERAAAEIRRYKALRP